MDSTLATDTTQPLKAPLNRRFVWLAVIIATVLPLILLAAVIAVLASTNYNFLEWME